MHEDPPVSDDKRKSDTWTVLRRLWPEVWRYRGRVAAALVLLVAGKLATIGVPLVLKRLVDALDITPRPLLVPVALLLAYGALRLGMSAFQELRTIVFARVLARTSRNITLRAFEHLHKLSLRFHLDRRTGGVARDVERGMTATSDLLDWTIYTILPTLLEVTLVCGILVSRFDWTFAAITLGTLVAYMRENGMGNSTRLLENYYFERLEKIVEKLHEQRDGVFWQEVFDHNKPVKQW